MENNTENGSIGRRKFLTGVGAALTTGVAGCADNSQPGTSNPDNNNNSNSTAEEEPEPQEPEGLQLDFTWEDIQQAETEFYEQKANYVPNGSDKSGIEIANPSHVQNADLRDYQEFQDALVTTLNEIVHYQGERTPGDSSAMTSGAAAAVNLVLQDELENNEDYTDFNAKMIQLGGGHGYTQVASNIHPLTLVDSNYPAVGPATERPLQERPESSKASDPIGQFDEAHLSDPDASDKRASYDEIIRKIYSNNSKTTDKLGVPQKLMPEYFGEAVLAEDGELFIGPVRDTIASLTYIFEQDQFDDVLEYLDESSDNYEAVAITSTPSELPVREDKEVEEYAEEIFDEHVELLSSHSEAYDQFYGTV